ncbi:MAG: hypothetical protein JSV19_07655 [Phycisphaerales bacterium]|nr:MAG: hypothetical protein JSV19_07655 [Phycisphaerales bacterium]
MVFGSAAAIMLAAVAAASTIGQSSPGTTRPAAPDLGAAFAAAAWDLSTTGLAGGCPDAKAYQKHLDDRAAELLSTAADLPARLATAQHLAAANWILARQIEPAASRWFLDMPLPEDRKNILTAVRQARSEITRARAASPSAASTTRPAGAEALSADKHLLGTLDTFARAIEAVFTESDADPNVTANGHAAFQLALLLEDDRPLVVSAARLWRAALFRRMGRADRALDLLPYALTELSAGSARFDFYSRLFRCRCIADRGGHAAACTVLLQLEGRCHEWFTHPQDQADAERAGALLRIKILTRWRNALDADSASAERDWCAAAVERIRESACGSAGRCPVIRLGLAVPMLVAAPDDPAAEPPQLPATRAVDTP